MSLEGQLLDVEKRLWRNDAQLYHDNLLEEALLVFPETGVIARDVAVDAILAENADSRKWAEVGFEEVRGVRLTEDVALLTYRVTARWAQEDSEYLAVASSVYVKREGAWKLALHQQSPLGAE